jgi:hypothetical protein
VVLFAHIFHVAPDGGTGVLELAIMLVVVIVPLAVDVFRRRRAQGTSSRRALQK